jgi:hypothetical protein
MVLTLFIGAALTIVSVQRTHPCAQTITLVF